MQIAVGSTSGHRLPWGLPCHDWSCQGQTKFKLTPLHQAARNWAKETLCLWKSLNILEPLAGARSVCWHLLVVQVTDRFRFARCYLTTRQDGCWAHGKQGKKAEKGRMVTPRFCIFWQYFPHYFRLLNRLFLVLLDC